MISMQSAISAMQSYGVGGGGAGGGGDGVSLLDWDDFTYEGSFIPPSNGTSGTAELTYGGGGLWYNPTNNSLLIRGRDSFLDILEMEIPATLTDGTAVGATSDLATGTMLQGRRFTTSEIPNYTIGAGPKIGGLLLKGTKIFAQMYEYYDNPPFNETNVIYFDSATLSGADIFGMYKIGGASSSKNASYVSGYFGDIPTAKQAKLGGYAYFGGNNGLAITSRCSQGPVFVGFDPDDIGVTEPTDGGWYLYYEDNNRLGWDNDAVWNPISRAWGGFIPDGTNCVIFIGRNAVAGSKGYVETGYGTGDAFNDSCSSAQGYHSTNGDYGAYYWAYDLDDLEAAKNGTISPYAITPYAHGEFTFPFPTCQYFPNGCAYDRANKKVYTCEPQAHQVGSYTFLPVFHCWSHS